VGHYVRRDPISGLFNTTPHGFLSAHPSQDEAPIGIVLGREEDISARVGATSPTYTLPAGIAYENTSAGSTFAFRDAIVEYRDNIGIRSTKPSKIAGKETVYLGSYASIGVPAKRFDWMVDSVEREHGLKMARDMKYGKRHNGYVWITANISTIAPTSVIVSSTGTDRVLLQGLVKQLKQHVMGIVCTTVSLRRVEENGELKRAFSFGLKCVQVLQTTKISSPPLSSTVEFIEDSQAFASTEILNVINAEKSKAQKSGTKPIHESTGVEDT